MAFTHVDFAIAAGVFLVFVGILFGYITNYLTNYQNMAMTSELRGVASDLFNTFFTGKGVPSNWDEQSFTPVKIGLINDLYRIAINVTETNGTNRDNIAINGTVNFDSTCSRNVLNNTVRLYNSSNSQVSFQLYNQTFCSSTHLKTGEIVFNLSLSASQTKFFFVYFSPEKNVTSASYSVAFPVNETNYTFQTFPIEELQTISIDRLKTLRGLDFTEVVQTLIKGYLFKVEVSS